MNASILPFVASDTKTVGSLGIKSKHILAWGHIVNIIISNQARYLNEVWMAIRTQIITTNPTITADHDVTQTEEMSKMESNSPIRIPPPKRKNKIAGNTCSHVGDQSGNQFMVLNQFFRFMQYEIIVVLIMNLILRSHVY